ncbi:MAG: subtype A tannase [Oscillospiraceae bacterium]
MNRKSKITAVIAVLTVLAVLGTGCAKTADTSSETSVIPTSETSASTTAGMSLDEIVSEQEGEIVTNLNKIDNTKWQYNEADNVYWQVGIAYCENPADTQYETLGIFVPGDYMTAEDNGDGTFTCEINTDASVGNYTAMSAPVVIPVDTPGYSAMAAPTGYVNGVSDYTNAGFIYLNAGCRGRDSGAPAGVTDLKAAIRYLRYNEDNVPGSMDIIFTFGMSGGGAQSALVGATGDSGLYEPYLEAIGAVNGVSDAVAGSMCWCPITNLDYANEAYEWNMGVTRTDLDEETRQLSDSMAEAFAEYINALGLKDSGGNVLSLSESEDGIYQSGSYYDYLMGVVENSLNNFLSDTQFPYTAEGSGTKGGRGDFGGGLPNLANGELPDGIEGGGFPDGTRDGGFGKNGMTPPSLDGNIAGENEFYERDGIDRNIVSGGVSLSGIYETAQDYIDALNADTVWITYNSETNTAEITCLADFVKACKNASKNVGAFDDLNAAQGENTLFGYGDGNGAHFDPIMAELLKDTEYGAAYAADLSKTDALGNTVDERMNMYNPMYYLDDYYEGYRSANVAQYWRIRTGITQGDTALCTEVNLALALENYGADVDFETVWGQGHVEAERTGNSTENFINWVNECLG